MRGAACGRDGQRDEQSRRDGHGHCRYPRRLPGDRYTGAPDTHRHCAELDRAHRRADRGHAETGGVLQKDRRERQNCELRHTQHADAEHDAPDHRVCQWRGAVAARSAVHSVRRFVQPAPGEPAGDRAHCRQRAEHRPEAMRRGEPRQQRSADAAPPSGTAVCRMLIARPRSPSSNQAITARPLDPLTLPPSRPSAHIVKTSQPSVAMDGTAKRLIATSTAAVESKPFSNTGRSPQRSVHAPRQFRKCDAQAERAEREPQFAVAQVKAAAHPQGGRGNARRRGRKARVGRNTDAEHLPAMRAARRDRLLRFQYDMRGVAIMQSGWN